MALSFDTTLRNNRADEITASAGTSAVLRIYSGTAPANAGTATGGGNTLLAELTCGTALAPAASTGVGGVLTLNAITQDSSANATGTATFFRIINSTNGTAIVQGTVTATGGGGDLTLNTTSISSGAAVSITSFVITEGNA
jgi:hypothetical protein